MLSVVIKDNGEKNVIAMTYDIIWREIKDIPGSEIIVSSDWFAELPNIKNTFVSFVEPDCLVSSGYFNSMIGLFEKSRMLRKLAMISPTVSVKHWANRFYGYSVVNSEQPFVQPNKEMKSRGMYPVQVGYLPGALIRTSSLKAMLDSADFTPDTDWDLVYLSSQVSLGFWKYGDGQRVLVNPNGTYVTTEDYVNDLGQFDPGATDLADLFRRESI